jgi:hypothetical protein
MLNSKLGDQVRGKYWIGEVLTILHAESLEIP